MVVKWKCYKRIILQCLPKDADSNPRDAMWWPELMTSRTCCHGPWLVTFFLKNNHWMALMESLMMAISPLFSATLTTSHPRRTYIGPLSKFFPYSDTTNKSAFLSLPLPTSTMPYSTAAQPEPHHTPHTFHVVGQSYRAHTSSRGHGFWSPQGLARI